MTDLKLAAQKALEAMERAFDYPADHFDTPENEPYTMTVLGLNLHMVRDSIAALRSALQHQEEREPVATVTANGDTIKLNRRLPLGTKLYATPPLLQKEEGDV